MDRDNMGHGQRQRGTPCEWPGLLTVFTFWQRIPIGAILVAAILLSEKA